MNYSCLLMFLLTILSCNQVIADCEISGDSIVVIDYGETSLLRNNNCQNTKSYLNSKFEKITYVSTMNRNEVDSLYSAYNKAIIFERRWIKIISDNCCYGNCENHKVWLLTTSLQVKSNVESCFLLNEYDKNELQELIATLLDKKEEYPVQTPKKLFVEYANTIEVEVNYIKILEEEFGKENIIEVTFLNRFTAQNELSLSSNYITVRFSYNVKNEYIAEWQDTKGRILRTIILKN